jgi:AbrB family looped-hinge helix DNA binding protein
MPFATITSKGQTTIPKIVRDAAGLRAGDKMHFTLLDDGTILLRVKNRGIRDLMIKPGKGRHVTIEQMDR